MNGRFLSCRAAPAVSGRGGTGHFSSIWPIRRPVSADVARMLGVDTARRVLARVSRAAWRLEQAERDRTWALVSVLARRVRWGAAGRPGSRGEQWVRSSGRPGRHQPQGSSTADDRRRHPTRAPACSVTVPICLIRGRGGGHIGRRMLMLSLEILAAAARQRPGQRLGGGFGRG